MKISQFLFAMGLVVCACLSLSVSTGYADFYKWVDENGTVWLTDDPRNLPNGSQGQFQKVMTTEEPPESPASEEGSTMATGEGVELLPVGAKLKEPAEDLEDRNMLEQEISTLEQNLSAARRALKLVPLTDRRGYWFVIDPNTGKKARATYREPNAIWTTQSWSAVPRSEATRESEERRRILSDMRRFESDLIAAREKLSRLSSGL
ncbi:MAG: DUF4124 domain-containing protein [Proteobacteria bacterium]|nr:DUF4124 domain-containing protein [Pseudomonadota bacterium]NIS69306.1 DUF4124 domain-containing protein [Pseudomonadota bacterium]